MFARLLALFLITPVVELALLIQLGDLIGFWPTIAIIVATGFVGSYLARREGVSAWRRFQDRLREGGLPGKELLDGVLILVAGVLLITPGVLSDVVGLLGLLPVTRALIRRQVYRRIERAMQKGTIRVGFGGFGDAWFDPSAERPPTSESATSATTDASAAWRGERQTTPRYRQNEGGDDVPPPPALP